MKTFKIHLIRHGLTEGNHCLGRLAIANISRTPNLVHLREETLEWLIEGAVKVGYDTYAQHLAS